MRIHILHTGFVSKTSMSGGDQLIFDIVSRLPKEWEFVVITPEFAKVFWKTVSHPYLEFRYLPSNRFDFRGDPFSTFWSYVIRAWQTYQILKRERDIKVVYSCSDVAYADVWPAFLIARTEKLKWISRVYHVLLPPGVRQGNLFINLVAVWLQRLSFWSMKKRSWVTLALNEKLRLELIELGFSESKTKILGAGIDFNYIHNYKPSKKYEYEVVALGRVAAVKGIFDTVKIWKEVHKYNPKWKLCWIGQGDPGTTQQIRHKIKKEGLQNSFLMKGFLEKRVVLDIFKSAKVFICPDHENGWGLAVSEAMSASLPVVSYSIDIFGSVYKKGFLSCPLFDTQAFAANLIRVLEDKNLRDKSARQAREQASQFDLDKVVRDFAKILGS